MDTEEFYGVPEDKLFEFVDECATEDGKLLEIKTSEQVAKFVLIAKKFSGASILGFSYDSGNSSPRRLSKRSNDIIITIGAEVFLPGLRYGETYDYSIKMLFKDVIDFSFIPGSVEDSTEIGIEKFEIENGICEFRCFSKKDETKVIRIRSKYLFIENFIDPEDADEEDVVVPDSIIERARFMYKQQNYRECIRILKFEYFDLEKDARANNLMYLCYSAINNQYEALRYINYAIELEPNACLYYYNKAFCLFKSNLELDSLKCFNKGLSLAESEEDKRQFSKNIIDIVNAKTRFYHTLDIKDAKSFDEYLYYFDSIINLEYCFPEFKEKFKQYKNEAISYFYNNLKREMDNSFGINRDYSLLAEKFESILRVEGLEDKIKNGAQKYLDNCNDILEKERIENETKEELKAYVSDLISKEYSREEILEAARTKFPAVWKYDVETIVDKQIKVPTLHSSIPISPLPPAWKKKNTIRDYIDSGMSKAEMVEQLSADFGISEESALASINAYYQDDGLGLKEYFDDFDEDEDDIFFDDDFDDELEDDF